MPPSTRLSGRLSGLVALLALLAGGPSVAQSQDRGVFDIYLGPFKVGLFAFSGVEERGRYSTAGQLRSIGLIGAIADVRYDAKSRGRVLDGGYVPESYEERANIGSRSTDLVMSYKNGVPGPPLFNPPRDSDRPALDPRAQGDAIDLMTMFYALLRDQPEAEVCGQESHVFDGVRRTRVRLQVESRAPGQITCAAQYRRIAGFSAWELRERPVFPFRLVYVGNDDGTYSAEEGVLETVYGIIRLERRPAG